MKGFAFMGCPPKRRKAFALVEVVLALGVVSFCLVAIMGVMSVGFSGMKNSDDQSAGAMVVEQIASDIRGASTNASGTYVGLGMCNNLSWTLSGTPTTITQTYTNSLGGFQSTTDKRLVARVEVTPPATLASPGTALVSVAWPVEAQWNEASKSWSNAQGSLTTYLVFLPRP
jgi:uncharacterized protein (TIGR02598 family)